MDERAPVQIGVDLRPLPLQVGDDIWYFEADPGKEFFAKVSGIDQVDDEDAAAVIDYMTESLVTILTDQSQREDFISRNYGLKVLTRLAEKINEDTTDLPMPPSPVSGKQQASGGGKRSQTGRPRG